MLLYRNTIVKVSRYLEKSIVNIGFLDIETQGDNFKAQSGYIVSWVLKIYNLKTKKIKTWEMIIDKNTIKSCNKKENLNYDYKIIPELIRTMKECDLIVTHYGTWFDIPFIRTRSQKLKIPFIVHSDKIRFADTWKMARLMGSFRSNSLENVASTLGIKLKKTKVDYTHWKLSVFGKKKHFDYILKHNEIDVEILFKVWQILEGSAPIPARYY